MAEVTYIQAISNGLREEMRRDDRVLVIGEDVGVYGGAFKVTLGFQEEFGPWRVIDAPLAETAILGGATGAAMMGMRPVAEMQFADFVSCAWDHLVTVAAKQHFRAGTPIPIVLRLPSGGGFSGGPFHSQNPEAWFLQAPGLKVVGFGLAETEENVLAYARAGVAGYVLREASLDDLVTALRGIARGEVRYSRRISATLLHRLATGLVPSAGAVQLTPRETEIVRLIDEGLSNRAIAARLKIGLPTVKNHVHNLLEKLQVHRRGEAVAGWGLLDRFGVDVGDRVTVEANSKPLDLTIVGWYREGEDTGEVLRFPLAGLGLAASGLLSTKVGGPSVFPPMPPDVAALSYANNFRWATSEGDDRYRRGTRSETTSDARPRPRRNRTAYRGPSLSAGKDGRSGRSPDEPPGPHFF